MSNVNVEWLEFTGLYWGGQPGYGFAFYVLMSQSGSGITFQNNYFHGWAHAPAPTSGEGEGCCEVVLGSTGVNDDLTQIWAYNVIDGSDTTKDSFGVSYGGPGVFHDNYINYAFSDTFNGSYCDFHGNTLLNTGQSYAESEPSGGPHPNTFESNTDCARGLLQYNNYFEHVEYGSNGNYGVLDWSAPQSGSKSYTFNNVFVDTNPIGSNNLMCEGALQNSGGGCVYFNNTEECGLDISPDQSCGSYWSIGNISVINNHFITSGNCPTLDNNGGGAPAGTYTTNTCQTKSVANGQGYNISQPYPFFPTIISNATVNAGTNETSICNTISSLDAAAGSACLKDSAVGVGYDAVNHVVRVPNRTSIARPTNGPWNTGAYVFSGPTPNPPTGLKATAQ